MKSSGYVHNHIEGACGLCQPTVGFDQVFGARPLRKLIQNEIAESSFTDVAVGKVVTGKNYELQLDACFLDI